MTYTDGQIAARQVVKLVEELFELAMCIGSARGMWYPELITCGDAARRAFDNGPVGDIPPLLVDQAISEATDIQVVLCTLQEYLGKIAGRRVDLRLLALEKARGDVARGVR